MKKRFLLLAFLPAALALNACKTVRAEGPQVKIPAAKPKLEQAKLSLKDKKAAMKQIPPVLGGIIASDSWVIYKDKQQEEFRGNVSYDNGTYLFRADYALSERALNRFSARGNVYVKQTEPQGATYEAYADFARYNYTTLKGVLQANAGNTVRLIYSDKNQPPLTATAQKVSFDLEKEVFVLEKNVRVERPTPQGLQTMTAQKATLKQQENYVILEEGASVSDSLRTLEAKTIIYDGNNNASYAYGSRPLVHGQSEQGTFAIIADKVQADNAGNKVDLDGKVQGWVVSPQLNESEINQKF